MRWRTCIDLEWVRTVVAVVMGHAALRGRCWNGVYLLTEGKGAVVWVFWALNRHVCMSTNVAAGRQTLLCWRIRTAGKVILRGDRLTCTGFRPLGQLHTAQTWCGFVRGVCWYLWVILRL